METRVLVGDIGGTNARFGIATRDGAGIHLEAFETLEGDGFASFKEAMGAYLSRIDSTPRHALLAVAGIIKGGDVAMTNRAWTVSSSSLEQTFGFASVRLVNDFAAMARAIPELEADQFTTLRAATADPAAPILVAGAGTGLGVATLLPEAGNKWRVIGGEGGHCAYSPQTRLEFELAALLRAEFGYVSNELVCSGMGMEPLHRGLCQLAGIAYEVALPQAVLDRADAGDEICLNVCRIRARAIMSAVGDAVLTNATWGGVVLAGGVTARLQAYLCETESLARFDARGPRTEAMMGIPIKMLTQDTAALRGAAALFFKA